MIENIIKNRYLYIGVSGGLLILSLFFIFFGKLNFGIDMTGGIQMEFSYQEYSYNAEKILSEAEVISEHINLQGSIINTVKSYKITGENTFVVEVGFNRGIEERLLEEYKTDYRKQIENIYQEMGDIELSKYTNIGASFGDYIRNTALLTLFIAIIAIALYIAYAFSGTVSGISSLSFAGITLITLFHDVIISSGLYVFISYFLPQFQIDTFFVTALLTILGYSINDTIVIFDRIRSNLRDFGGKKQDLESLITLSLKESLTRSVYTSLTLVFVLVCVLIFGPDSISGFTLTMLLGTLVGTYSSIFIAAPLLYELHKNTTLSVYIKKEDLSEDEKMVV